MWPAGLLRHPAAQHDIVTGYRGRKQVSLVAAAAAAAAVAAVVAHDSRIAMIANSINFIYASTCECESPILLPLFFRFDGTLVA